MPNKQVFSYYNFQGIFPVGPSCLEEVQELLIWHPQAMSHL